MRSRESAAQPGAPGGSAARTWLASRWADVALTVVVASFDIVTQWEMAETRGLVYDVALPTWLLWLSPLGYLPLLWRRQAPMLVFVLLWLHSVTCHLLIPGYRPTLAVLVALYTVASRLRLVPSLLALIGAFVVSGLSIASEYRFSTDAANRTDTLVVGILLFLLLDLAVWGGGLAVAASRRERALLTAARQYAARDAVRAERTRLARDMHDVVAHSVTLIVLQAAAARRREQSSASDEAARALADIEALGARTMNELHDLLGLLDEPPDAHDSSLDFDDLVEPIRAAGLRVALSVSGVPRTVDSAIDLAARRIVQEGLTNALKYAGVGAAVTIRITWSDEALSITVSDDGGGRRDPVLEGLSSGRGLAGLENRIVTLGGSLTTASTQDGGFEVAATLPLLASGIALDR